MDYSQTAVFDNVKFEKAKAIARYNRLKKISKLLQFLEVLAALALISWSSTRLPGAVKLSGQFLFELARYVCNPHVVFLISNAIVVALFVLRRENDSSGNDYSGSGDLYDDYVRQGLRKAYVPEEVKIPPPPTTEIKDVNPDDSAGGGGDEEEKQIVCVYSEEGEEQCDAVTMAIETATKQIEKFQRTQSVVLKREIAGKSQPVELRRSETVKVAGRRAERLAMTSFDTVDKLSNEEFNMTVEAAIKRHQAFLMAQKLAENEELKVDTSIRKNYRCASVR